MKTSIELDKLELWFKTSKPGDIAFHFDVPAERYWIYIYREEDTAPCWHLFNDVVSAQKYLDGDKESNMNKRCDNCKYYSKIPGTYAWCTHEKHNGMYVPGFVSCQEHEHKEEKPGPFDNLKFFIKDANTGEVELKYVCEDCGKVMTDPSHWQFRVPLIEKDKPNKRLGYCYWCEDCWEKEKKK